MIREYKTIREISGPLMVVDHVQGVTYDELAEIVLSDGSTRRCKVLEVNGDRAVVQLFEASAGINLADSRIRFLGHPLQLAVSRDMLGHVFNGMGQPIDGAQLPQRVHPDRHFKHRWPQYPCPRTKAADLLRLGPAARAAGRADRATGEGAGRREQLCCCLCRHRHHV